MNNIKVLHERPGMNGWVVRADTIRFGRNEIMFEGTFRECIKYSQRPLTNWLVGSIDILVNGYDERYGNYFDNAIYRVTRKGSRRVSGMTF